MSMHAYLCYCRWKLKLQNLSSIDETLHVLVSVLHAIEVKWFEEIDG